MTNNNSQDSALLNQATVRAVLQPQSSAPSFAIPLVRPNERTNTDYTPTVNLYGKIDGFLPVEPKGRMLPYRQESNVRIGQDEIFALIDPDDNPSVGTKQALIPQIEKWIYRVDDELCRLNFALFCNNHEYAVDLGQTVFSQKHAELGDKKGAARWFVSAFVCLPLLRELTAHFSRTTPSEIKMLEALTPRFILSPTSLMIIFPDNFFAHDSIAKFVPSKNLKQIIKFAQRSTGFEMIIETDLSRRVVSMSD